MGKKDKEVTTSHYTETPTVNVEVDVDTQAEDGSERAEDGSESVLAAVPVEDLGESLDERIARYEAELEKVEKKTPREVALRAGLEALRWVKTL